VLTTAEGKHPRQLSVGNYFPSSPGIAQIGLENSNAMPYFRGLILERLVRLQAVSSVIVG
jgi:hypothetical protein